MDSSFKKPLKLNIRLRHIEFKWLIFKNLNQIQVDINEILKNKVYKRLDQPRLGGVKIADLAEFANDHALSLPNDALNYLFNYFDVDEDGIITREEYFYLFNII